MWSRGQRFKVAVFSFKWWGRRPSAKTKMAGDSSLVWMRRGAKKKAHRRGDALPWNGARGRLGFETAETAFEDGGDDVLKHVS
jgi:hypothetical protein